MNQASINISGTAKDRAPDILVGVFQSVVPDITAVNPGDMINVQGGNGDYFYTEVRIAEKVTLQAGLTPSYAIVSIPMARFGPGHWDEEAYSCALVNSGPAVKILPRSRASIYIRTGSGQKIPLMCGSVVKVAHGIEHDDLLVTVFDDRWLLSKITVFGQAQHDPTYGISGFVAAEPCIFNERGFPNCIDTESGPMFAPTFRFGWAINPQSIGSEQYNELTAGSAQYSARYWTVGDAVTYLRKMHAADGARPECAGNYGNQKLSKSLCWPKDLGGALLTSGANRRLHNVSVEGLTLGAALTKIAQRAGPYELYCTPGAAGGSDNEAVEDGPIGKTGFYTAFKADFGAVVDGMNTAFNSGYSQFTNAINAATATIGAYINNFQRQLGTFSDNTPSRKLKDAHTKLVNTIAAIPSTETGTLARFKAAADSTWKDYLAASGSALENNPGLFKLTNGAITGGGSADSTVGIGSSGAAGSHPDKIGLSLKDLASNVGTGGNKSTLVFVDLRGPKSGNGIIVPKLYGLTVADAMSGGFSCTNSGYVVEDVEDYYDDCCILGDAPVIESLFSSDPTDAANYYLEPAWSTADEADFIRYCTTGAAANTPLKFNEACLLWPLVYAAFRIKPGFITKFAATKWSDTKVNRAHPRIRPTLISGYQQNVGNPRAWIPRPVVIEYKDPITSTWKAATQYDNLTVSPDGQYFTVTALRDNGPGVTFHASGSGGYDAAYFTAIPIRATLAIELDWRIGALGSASGSADPNKVGARVNKGENFVYTTLADDLDYVDWTRYGAKPVGQNIPEKYRQFPDRAIPAEELFTDWPINPRNPSQSLPGRLSEHSKARLVDVRRIGYSGSIKFPLLAGGFTPGVHIKGVQGSDMPFSGVVHSVIFSPSDMTVQLANTAALGIPDTIK